MDDDKNKHAVLSPSGADRWMVCPGSVELCKGRPDAPSIYSVEGTDLHEVAAVCLVEDKEAASLIGCEMLSGALLEKEQAEAVQKYVDVVRSYRDSMKGTLTVESKVPLHWLTGEEGAEGTADAVVIGDSELAVIDAKFGRGVAVTAEHNRQAMIYALGVLERHLLWNEITSVRIVICQPRLGGSSEWVVTMAELDAFMLEVRAAVKLIEKDCHRLVPSEKGCRFCKAKAVCPAIEKLVDATMLDGFAAHVDIELGAGGTTPSANPVAAAEPAVMDHARLGAIMERIPMIESWIKEIRAEVERRLLAGEAIPGWKLVQGRKGNREWDNADEVEALFKAARYTMEEMYSMTLISPTKAQALIAKKHPKRWADFEDHIVQREGVPSVAPESDTRPALMVEKPEEGFAPVDNEWEGLL